MPQNVPTATFASEGKSTSTPKGVFILPHESRAQTASPIIALRFLLEKRLVPKEYPFHSTISNDHQEQPSPQAEF